jgi:hypothetical protein
MRFGTWNVRSFYRAGSLMTVSEKLTYEDKCWVDRRGWYGLDWSGSRQEPVEVSCEQGIEPLGSINFWEVLD